MKRSQKTSVTKRNVSPAHNAQVYSAWKPPAQTPTMPSVCATMATTWINSLNGVNPAPNVLKARACCSAVGSTMTLCVRSAPRTPTQTRKVLESPASPAPPVMTGRCYRPAHLSVIQFVKVRWLSHSVLVCTCQIRTLKRAIGWLLCAHIHTYVVGLYTTILGCKQTLAWTKADDEIYVMWTFAATWMC